MRIAAHNSIMHQNAVSPFKVSFVMYAKFGGADEVNTCQKGKQKLKR